MSFVPPTVPSSDRLRSLIISLRSRPPSSLKNIFLKKDRDVEQFTFHRDYFVDFFSPVRDRVSPAGHPIFVWSRCACGRQLIKIQNNFFKLNYFDVVILFGFLFLKKNWFNWSVISLIKSPVKEKIKQQPKLARPLQKKLLKNKMFQDTRLPSVVSVVAHWLTWAPSCGLFNISSFEFISPFRLNMFG